MTRIITICLMLAATIAMAQKATVEITTKTDQFTGKTTVITSPIKYALGPYSTQPSLSFLLFKGADGLALVALVGLTELELFRAGDELLLKFADGEIMKLAAIADAESDVIAVGNYSYQLFFEVTEDQVEALTRQPIEVVRVSTRSKNYDVAPAGKKYPESCRLDFLKFYETVVKG